MAGSSVLHCMAGSVAIIIIAIIGIANSAIAGHNAPAHTRVFCLLHLDRWKSQRGACAVQPIHDHLLGSVLAVHDSPDCQVFCRLAKLGLGSVASRHAEHSAWADSGTCWVLLVG